MRLTLTLACPVSLTLLLACTTPGPEARPFTPHERVGTAGFSVEVPPGKSWELRRTDFSLTLERRTASWRRVAETVQICVSRHSLAPVRGNLTERELAALFLEAEKALLCETEAEEDVRTLAQFEPMRHGRKLYELTYDIYSRYRSDVPAWGDDVLLREGEIYVYFPDGPRGAHFYCFEIRVTHRTGYSQPSGTLRLIDQIIDSFRREQPDGPSDPAQLQSFRDADL